MTKKTRVLGIGLLAVLMGGQTMQANHCGGTITGSDPPTRCSSTLATTSATRGTRTSMEPSQTGTSPRS